MVELTIEPTYYESTKRRVPQITYVATLKRNRQVILVSVVNVSKKPSVVTFKFLESMKSSPRNGLVDEILLLATDGQSYGLRAWTTLR